MKNPTSKLKICVLGSSYPCHEADPQVPWLRNAVNRMAARHHVTVVAPSFGGISSHTIDGVRVLRFRYAPARFETLEGASTDVEQAPPRLSPWLALPYFVAGSLALFYWTLQNRFDIINVQGVYPSGVLALLSRLLGTKIVAACDEQELLPASQSGWTRPLFAWYLRRADSCTCPSRHTSRQLKEISGREAEIIPYGPDAAITTGRLALPFKPKGVDQVSTLLYCHSGLENPDLTCLIRALPQILAQRNVHLVVAGDIHHWVGSRALSYALGVHNHVRFIQGVDSDEVGELCRTCDVYVHPSASEEQHRTVAAHATLVAAMLNDRPVVASASAAGGIIKNRENGLIVPNNDPSALAQNILDLLESPQLAMRLGRAGRLFAEHYFDWACITDQTEALYLAVKHRHAKRDAARPSNRVGEMALVG